MNKQLCNQCAEKENGTSQCQKCENNSNYAVKDGKIKNYFLYIGEEKSIKKIESIFSGIKFEYNVVIYSTNFYDFEIFLSNYNSIEGNVLFICRDYSNKFILEGLKSLCGTVLVEEKQPESQPKQYTVVCICGLPETSDKKADYSAKFDKNAIDFADFLGSYYFKSKGKWIDLDGKGAFTTSEVYEIFKNQHGK